MEIRDVEAIPLSYPLSAGERYGGSRGLADRRTATLIRLTTADGTVGWGEAFGPPMVVAAAVDGALGEAVVGRTPSTPGSLVDDVYAGEITGYHFAREGTTLAALSGLEVALWDLQGKACSTPVRDLLDSRSREKVTPYATTMYFTDGDDEPVNVMAAAVEEGFGAAKIKVGRGVTDDVRRTRIAREALGPEATLLVDYNGNYDAATAIRSIRAVDTYDVAWAEEPVPPEDESGYRHVRTSVDVPLAAGEACFDRFSFTRLVRDGLVDVVQPNLGRCGGFSEARYVAQLTSTANVLVRPHVWNSAVGMAAALQFAATCPVYPSPTYEARSEVLFECDRGENPLRTALLQDRFDPTGGSLEVPAGPGLGIDVDEDVVEQFRID